MKFKKFFSQITRIVNKHNIHLILSNFHKLLALVISEILHAISTVLQMILYLSKITTLKLFYCKLHVLKYIDALEKYFWRLDCSYVSLCCLLAVNRSFRASWLLIPLCVINIYRLRLPLTTRTIVLLFATLAM